MVEPTNAVMPILKRIQSDVADVKRVQAEQNEKLDSIEGYLTFNLGISQRRGADIESLKEQVAAIKRRVTALEKRK